MSTEPTSIDDLLVQWGDRYFYPGNRIVKNTSLPNLSGRLIKQRANAIRARIEATVVRRSPQVMVKVTGGGRGMNAIAAHFKYISKNGRLEIENESGDILNGKDDLRELADEWRLGGSRIDEKGWRREAFNIMLSMPRGVDSLYVLQAARDFAREEFADHKFVMVLHDHQANPHVHLSVRAESKTVKRLNPRKADLQRWRARFAENLRGLGIEAESSSRALRGAGEAYEPLWRIKAREDARLRGATPTRPSSRAMPTHTAWREAAEMLFTSNVARDRLLAQRITLYPQREGVRRASGSPPEGERTR